MWRRCLPALALALLAGACSSPRDPIVLNDNIVSIENQSSREWRNVVVTVNDHFQGGSPSLAAGGLLTAPLSTFQTAFGQRFAVGRQAVFKIEVKATDARGEAVSLEWDIKKRS